MSLMKWLQYWEKRDEIESKGMNNDDTISIKRERGVFHGWQYNGYEKFNYE